MAGKHSGVFAALRAAEKPAFLRPGFVMELRRGLRYALEFWVPDNDIPGSSLRYDRHFCGIYEICGQIFTKTIDRWLFVVYNVSCICVKTYKYRPEISAEGGWFWDYGRALISG
jgi:hypothetical protein